MKLGRLDTRQGVCGSDAERIRQMEELRTLYQKDSYREHSFLYESLTILDVKATSLLTFNSIVLAAATVFFISSSSDVFRVLFLIALLTMTGSCLLCLGVAWIHWTETPSMEDERRFWVELSRLKDKRTLSYRWAWLLSVIGLVELLATVVAGLVFSLAGVTPAF
jgi:hypothetical protein